MTSVKVLVVSVLELMLSENVAVGATESATPVAPGAGVCTVTVGGVVSEPPLVVYVAVYVAVAFATTLCVAAPPSDQEENVYVVPESVCGDGALIEFEEPLITIFVNGAAAVVLPAES